MLQMWHKSEKSEKVDKAEKAEKVLDEAEDNLLLFTITAESKSV